MRGGHIQHITVVMFGSADLRNLKFLAILFGECDKCKILLETHFLGMKCAYECTFLCVP